MGSLSVCSCEGDSCRLQRGGGLSDEEEEGDGVTLWLRYLGKRVGGGGGNGDPTKCGLTWRVCCRTRMWRCWVTSAACCRVALSCERRAEA